MVVLKRVLLVVLFGFILSVYGVLLTKTVLSDINPYVAGSFSSVCSDSGTTEWFCDHSDCDGGGGFESPWAPTSNAGNWDAFYGSPVSEGTIVKKGSISMECDSNQDSMYIDPGGTPTEIWFDVWFRAAATTGTAKLVQIHDASNKAYMYVDSAGDLEYTDDTPNTYDTTVDISTGTWYHMFVHMELGGGDGSETLRVAVNTTDTWDSWDYSNTSATLLITDASGNLRVGTHYNQNGDTYYFDDARFFYGTDMPCEWQ